MALDVTAAQAIVTVVTGSLAILGVIFGWFGKAARWIASLRGSKLAGTLDVPRKTMIVMPLSRPNALWWHMGTMNGQPAMQVVGTLSVTNISQHAVHVMHARLRKPRLQGEAFTPSQSGNAAIPERAVCEVTLHFWIQPVRRARRGVIKLDVSLVDQFGNDHWLRRLSFCNPQWKTTG